jgi:hypothetical protein
MSLSRAIVARESAGLFLLGCSFSFFFFPFSFFSFFSLLPFLPSPFQQALYAHIAGRKRTRASVRGVAALTAKELLEVVREQ